jgi:hypothetical protein
MFPRLCIHSRKVGREHLNLLQTIHSKGAQDNKEKCKIQIVVGIYKRVHFSVGQIS